MKNNLDAIFAPHSIAVVGASRESGGIGYDVLKNLLASGFAGDLFPINPKADGEILGLPAYHSLTAVGAPIDLIVIAIPAKGVAGILREAGALKIPGAIAITAGFKETGNIVEEEELKTIAKEHAIALIGPNCLGVISTVSKMNASFAASMPPAGRVGFLSQSGAVCTALLDGALKFGIGYSHFVSIGNKAVIDESELLEYLLHDDASSVIGMYIEDIAQPKKLLELLRRARNEGWFKPIVVLKSGRTKVGASASASHTGALAGMDEAYDAFFKQAGVYRADRMSDFVDTLRAFAHNPLPKGPNVAIVTNAGGPGVLTTDAVIKSGLKIPELSESTRTALAPYLPPAASTRNPIDLLGDADAKRYHLALEIIGNDSDIDSLLVLLTPQSSTDIEGTADAIIEARDRTGKPVIAAFMGGEMVEPGVRKLNSAGITVVPFPEEGAEIIAKLHSYHTHASPETEDWCITTKSDLEKTKALFKNATKDGRKGIPEADAIRILSAYGFPTLSSHQATSPTEAATIAKEISRPLAMKIISDDVLHKSDAGGVLLNIEPENAGAAYATIMANVAKNLPDAKLDGVLIVEMAPRSGTEVILGITRDAALGHLLMVGLGGIYVEVLKDVAFGLTPITPRDAIRMIDSLKTRRLFDGVRGNPPLDIDALIENIGLLSRFIVDFPNITELDMNPLLVLPKGQGVRVLDARIIVE